MKHLIKFSWIGSIAFVSSILIFGFLYPNYSHLSQFISELGATSAPQQIFMNYLGIIPFGLGIALFSISAFFYSKNLVLQKVGFSILFISGVLFVVAGLFSCDEGCNFENMSQAAIIHNISAFAAFIFSIVVQFFVSIYTFTKHRHQYHIYSLITMILSIIFFLLISKAGIESEFRGGYQRLFLTNFIVWLIISGIHFKKLTSII